MAKRFNFKLQTLLKVRQAEKDRHQRIVAERLRRIQGIRDEQADLQVRVSEALEEAAGIAARPRVDVGYLSRQRYWATHLQHRVLQGHVELQAQEHALQDERAKLAEAAVAVRVVEKLRERQLQRHLQAQERAERQEDDELAVLRYSFLRGAGRAAGGGA